MSDEPALATQPGLAAVGRWLRRRWRVLAIASGLLLATVAAAFMAPVRQRDAGGPSAPSIESVLAEAAAEDLTPLLDGVRWGTSLREALAVAAKASGQTAAASDQALAERAADVDSVRFVGYIAAEDRRSALLAFPDGEIVRLRPGESLRDGRAVAAVSDRSLTLGAEGEAAEVLALFPPVPVPPRGGQ